MKYKYFIVIFEEPGVGIPHYLDNLEELRALIDSSILLGKPFKVGHEFRQSLMVAHD